MPAEKKTWFGDDFGIQRPIMFQLWRKQPDPANAVPGSVRTGTRFLMWIDGVGGFLVCQGDEIVLGQAVPGTRVEVPILGDLSRRHAKIRREGEGCLIEPLGPVRVEGRRIESTTLLADGDEIQLGTNVRLQFRRPHPLSASARLDFLSRHRAQPAPDGVLLMADSCVLGPRERNHVVCRDWADDVVLFRQNDQLYCRACEPIEVDGHPSNGRQSITLNSHIAGYDFSMSLEAI